jgi:hypothetical protein
VAEPSYTVSGGAGGVGAHIDDMRTESTRLSTLTDQLVDQAVDAARIAMDAELLASAILSPITATAAEQKIIFATSQMLLFATEAGATAAFLAGAAAAYEDLDRSIGLLGNAAVNTGTFALGVMAVPLALAGGVVVLADVAAVYVAGYGGEAVDALGQGIDKTLDNPWWLMPPSLAVGAVTANTATVYDSADAQATVDGALAVQLDQLNEIAGDNAWFVDLIAQGAPGLLAGLTLPVTSVFGLTGKNALENLAGVPWPPTTYEQAVQAIIGGGNTLGYFQDGPQLGRGDIFLAPLPVGETMVELPSLTSPFRASGETAVEPSGLATLFQGSSQVDAFDDDNTFARIRITEIPGVPESPGVAGIPTSYIVQIPSTQSWDLAAGSTPNDVTADTHAMLARQTALSSAVDAAMQEAGITSANPVMLQGFSLGGITAGQMAADPNLNYDITHVVTGGAPIANFDIPPAVNVLSLEFHEDPVARLDGNDNPDSARWTTVHAPAPALPTDDGSTIGIAGAHNSDRYALTAAEVQASGDPSVTGYLESARIFFEGRHPAITTDYGARRRP